MTMTSILLSLVYGGIVAGFIGALDFASGDLDVAWYWTAPQGWLIVIAMATSWAFLKQKPSGHAWLFSAAFPVAVAFISLWWAFDWAPDNLSWASIVDNWYIAIQVDRTGLILIVFLYATLGSSALVFWPMHPGDVTAKGMWLILWVGEGYMVAEHFLCNLAYSVPGSQIINDKIAGIDGQSACARAGLEHLEWLPVAIQIGIMIWLVNLHQRAKVRARKG